MAISAGDRVGRVEALAGQRAIGAELARQPRQEPGRADVGKEADADLGHGEGESVAGNAMRAVHRDADAAAHDDAVDQRDVGFAIALDVALSGYSSRQNASASSCRPALPRS